jgi:hypothetical protein
MAREGELHVRYTGGQIADTVERDSFSSRPFRLSMANYSGTDPWVLRGCADRRVANVSMVHEESI